MADVNSNIESVQDGLIENGYFYTFTYIPNPNIKVGYDPAPFIYCIGPSEKHKNNFIALNLHHIPIKDRVQLIINMQKYYSFMEHAQKRVILSEKTLNSLVPGILVGIREYNRKNIFDPYRIYNTAVPLYYKAQESLVLSSPDEMLIKYLFKSKLYKGANINIVEKGKL